jgi:hypothetical protein
LPHVLVCARGKYFRPIQAFSACDIGQCLNGNADHMTFIIESSKDNRRTTDFRSSAEIAVTLARKLTADGYAVSITAPSGAVYSADRFDRLLRAESLNSQE